MENIMKPTAEEIQYAMNLVYALDEDGFSGCIKYHQKGSIYSLDNLEAFESQRDSWTDDGVKFYAGCTKVCIVDPKLEQWVIKISIDRRTNPAYDSDAQIDFCAEECNLYRLACDNHLENYFAPAFDIGTYCDMTVELQRRVRVDMDGISDCFYNYISEETDHDDYEDEDDYNGAVWNRVDDMEDDERIYAIFDGNEDIEALVQFIDDHSINDLHEGNWGYDYFTGQIYLMDYSGYVA